MGLPLSAQDVFLNVAGGLKVAEPSLDLAVAMAAVSSYRDSAVDDRSVVIGELGLSGEVRAVSRVPERVAEAARLGFKTAVVPRGNMKDARWAASAGLSVLPVATLAEAVDQWLK